MSDADRVRIAPVVVPKASDVLADRLRDLIVAGRFLPGEALPPERELAAESGLSRSSVREALRLLETEGLLTTRAGRAGGSVVTRPGRDSIARSVELFVRAHGMRLGALLDCRLAVEPMLARLAACNRTEAQLAEIAEIHARFEASVDKVPAYKRINLDWHLAVARASGNEPLMALMEAVAAPIRDAQEYRHVTTPELRRGAVRAHSVILEAIAAGDGEAAFKRMERHVGAYRDIALRREEVADDAVGAAAAPARLTGDDA
ncbi:FCD domain-containing protein [Albimonas sp. CAU 1670]|uniref:FadR/GntR family transcriptional regulator n=1 Tax=Albimonas sp. CAU 1670 TaxID=3032599 RepID=UPI0023DC78D8|nr:FCD domain-containing protein [Albimonas sp. CAU 1670]MDF2235686.1 FCD domain-containing protein [Albimonas sp. CAU 1670]